MLKFWVTPRQPGIDHVFIVSVGKIACLVNFTSHFIKIHET